MSKNNPYLGKPDRQFWKKEAGIRDPALFDPVVAPSFEIRREDPVVTAGSCFAQHVARHLSESGFNFLVTETPHPFVRPQVAARDNYGVFSARYGNVYTSRQLRQLLERAYGRFEPLDNAWQVGPSSYVDPFRPQIQPEGFISEQELKLDQQAHFAAVRRAVSTMRVFVFTLGLTECWMDSRDGAVFPLAPGVAGGAFDPEIHKFVNLGVDDVVRDLAWSIEFIRGINPDVRILLTVSPVPLNATALPRHVFVSTTYSKSVLRVAAELICERTKDCDYFPSYEIITSPYARGRYFGPDCRSVTEEGVSHVMSLFFRHYGGRADAVSETPTKVNKDAEFDKFVTDMTGVIEVLCDEERITNEA